MPEPLAACQSRTAPPRVAVHARLHLQALGCALARFFILIFKMQSGGTIRINGICRSSMNGNPRRDGGAEGGGEGVHVVNGVQYIIEP